MQANALDQTFLRETNLSAVLRLIQAQAPLSRAQLAVVTGLNKSTVSSLVDELIERHLVHEIGVNSAGMGRPATLLEIDPHGGHIIGLELGVDFISVGIADFSGNLIWQQKEEADPVQGQESMLAHSLHLVRDAITEGRKKKYRFLGMGLATPGTVDLKEGMLIFAPNLHWRDVHFRKIFSKAIKFKVHVENDANAAAIGEHLFGSARYLRDFIFVFAGVGIGGGLFLNGNLYRGKNGYAGEIGHFPMMTDHTLTPCHCGNRGCWETYANQFSIIQRVQARLEVRRDSILPKLMADARAPLSIALIKQAADAGDHEAIASFAEAGRAMGQGFAGLISIFNPDKIILGGPLSLAGEYLLPAIREVIPHHTLPEIDQQAEVIMSSFGPNASLIGAIAIVVDDVLSHPTQVERR